MNEQPLFRFRGRSPLPFVSNSILRFYRNDSGIVFTNNGGKGEFKPTLNTTEILTLMGKRIKTFTGQSEIDGSKYSLYEHLLATLYATGFHNIRVDISTLDLPFFGHLPPQPKNREMSLATVLMSQNRYAKPFEKLIQLPQYQRVGKNFEFMTVSPETDRLRISSRVDINGFDEAVEFDLESSYLQIANSRAYGPYYKWSSSYVGCETQDEVRETARHSIVDRLGALALLANTLESKLAGELITHRSGHQTDLENLRIIHSQLN